MLSIDVHQSVVPSGAIFMICPTTPQLFLNL